MRLKVQWENEMETEPDDLVTLETEVALGLSRGVRLALSKVFA